MKNAIILGDSYSTFEGYVPEGYDVYYSKDIAPERGNVKRVEDTWWYSLMKEKSLNLVLNNSWSGSPLCYTGYGNADRSKSSSFIYRFEQLAENGFLKENCIDTVFIFGATNDSWAGTALGEIKYSDFKREDLFNVLPAICYLLKRVRKVLPKADIYCLINTGLREQIADCFRTAAKKYGITAIDFNNIDKINGHPTVKGMKEIKDRVMEAL